MFPVGPMTQPRPSQSPVPAEQGKRAVKRCLGAELTREGLPGPLRPAALPSRVRTLRTDTPTPEAVAPLLGWGEGIQLGPWEARGGARWPAVPKPGPLCTNFGNTGGAGRGPRYGGAHGECRGSDSGARGAPQVPLAG